jgi:hypothetical protein
MKGDNMLNKWTPTNGDKYWAISDDGEPLWFYYDENNKVCRYDVAIGNCYKSQACAIYTYDVLTSTERNGCDGCKYIDQEVTEKPCSDCKMTFLKTTKDYDKIEDMYVRG